MKRSACVWLKKRGNYDDGGGSGGGGGGGGGAADDDEEEEEDKAKVLAQRFSNLIRNLIKNIPHF